MKTLPDCVPDQGTSDPDQGVRKVRMPLYLMLRD